MLPVERAFLPSWVPTTLNPSLSLTLQVGEHYLAEQWGQQLMTLQEFVSLHILGGSSSSRGGGGTGGGADGGEDADSGSSPHGSQTAMAAADAPQGERQAAAAAGEQQQQVEGLAASAAQRGYLAQHPLFDQIPGLRQDIREPPYCVLGQGEVQSVNAWIGPAGTVRVGWTAGGVGGEGKLCSALLPWGMLHLPHMLPCDSATKTV